MCGNFCIWKFSCRVLVAAAVVGSWAEARADLIITLSQFGTGTQISISGSGTVGGNSNPGSILDFLNFDGTPFNGSGSVEYSLSNPLLIAGLDSSDSDSPYTSAIGTIDINFDAGTTGQDLDLDGNYSIGVGDTYSASGTATVENLLFSSLNPGSYTASTSAGDADSFAPVTLNINTAAVPEPSGVGVLAVLGVGSG